MLSTINKIRANQSQLGITDKLKEIILGYGEVEDEITLDENTSKIELFDLFTDKSHYEECFINNPLLPLNLKSNTTWSDTSFSYLESKQNSLKYTPQQTSSIISGLHPHLTLIVGPPGTGKTDTAIQLLSLLLYNYPS